MKDSHGTKNTKRIALSGILAAFSVILLVLESIVPSGRLGFFILASFLSAVIVIESGAFYAWSFFIAVSLLSFILVPEKLGLVPYVLFFGVYAIIKNYIERINKIVVEYILKVLFFNVVFFISIKIVDQLFFNLNLIKLSWPVVLVILQVIFIAYDWLFSIFINYYYTNRNKIPFL